MLEHLAGTLALVGIVILVSSLLSGASERSGIPQVVVFLLLGTLLGPYGLGFVALTLQSPALQVLATLGLVLVLFTDAISVEIGEIRRRRGLALLVLGPGTLIPAALLALAGSALLGLPPLLALILGAALASTDPVLLRSVLRHPALPPVSRLALRLESGMNDVVLLPIIVLAMLALAPAGLHDSGEVVRRGVGLFLLGPALGMVTAYVAITLLERVRDRVGVRRDYESLYALGVALTAFAAAEAAGGSGFLAAFAAGLLISAADVELCDCFLDYGQATAEMFLLLTFVAFGASLIWSGLAVADPPTLVFAALALGVRTAVLLPGLGASGIDRRDRRLIAWFGPRGLSSLLLVLLPVFAGIPGAERLFAITSLVVLLSVVVHGALIAWFLRRSEAAGEPPPVPAPAPAAAGGAVADPERITPAEVRDLVDRGEPVVVADARTERTYAQDDLQAQGALRLSPNDAVRTAKAVGLAHHATVVVYCT